MSIKDHLSASKSKSMLVTLITSGLLARFSSNTASKLVVVYDNKILDCEEEHTHEVMDTLIPNQALRPLDEHLSQEIIIIIIIIIIINNNNNNSNNLIYRAGIYKHPSVTDPVEPDPVDYFPLSSRNLASTLPSEYFDFTRQFLCFPSDCSV